MADVKLIRLVAADGIPQSLKAYRTINVSGRPQSKVFTITNQRLFTPEAPVSPCKIEPKSDEDLDGAPLSKNALLARENRLKKKRYINSLEQDLSTCRKEKDSLTATLRDRDEEISKLKKEIDYFKSVLANVREISGLIRTIKGDSSMPMTTSLEPGEPPMKKMKTHEDYWLPQSPVDEEVPFKSTNYFDDDFNLFGDKLDDLGSSVPRGAGVCLHVFDKKLSLEFCSSCAYRAQEKWTDA